MSVQNKEDMRVEFYACRPIVSKVELRNVVDSFYSREKIKVEDFRVPFERRVTRSILNHYKLKGFFSA